MLSNEELNQADFECTIHRSERALKAAEKAYNEAKESHEYIVRLATYLRSLNLRQRREQDSD